MARRGDLVHDTAPAPAPAHAHCPSAYASPSAPPSTPVHHADVTAPTRTSPTPSPSCPSNNAADPFAHCTRWPSTARAHPPRAASFPQLPSMPTTTSRTYMPMPSFGAVFGGEQHSTAHTHTHTHTADRDPSAAHGNNVAQRTSTGNTTHGAPFSSFHNHHDSRDSNSTASSDNSPTTTISTMDSSSVTDPSPGPSPESPMPKITNHSFAADFRARRPETSDGVSTGHNFFELARPTTPAKKARNLKNLGINTTTSLTNLRTQPPAAPAAQASKEKNSSAPPSPLFIKPPTPPRRRPSNLSLTIATPGINDNKPTRLVIPSTPSLSRPALRHFQSSPSLPLCSPSVAPAGGLKFPALRPIVTKSSGLSEVPFEMTEEEEEEPNFDIPQSKEEKPAAYPNGPICIYPAGVYLYFEPTAEQAASFDVIVNVASEVQNPFTSRPSESQKDLNARRVDGPAAENVDFAALSQQPKSTFGFGNDSPTTPKAAPPVLQTIQPGQIVIDGKTYRTPEYIHMPWEHNTDIVPDLYKLVKIMDDRVKQGKRVLVHCQCGVSRSASLVVAYGLYKEPEISVQEAYDKAKKRSKWIGPNMNLIMQLQEFRNGLLRQNQNNRTQNQGFGRRVGLSSSAANNRFSCPNPERDDASGSRTPQTAPLPPDTDITMQRASTGNMMAISPGPLSAPSGVFAARFRNSWDSSQSNFDLSPSSTPTTTPYVDPKGHVVPVVEVKVNGSALAPMKIPAVPEVVQPAPESEPVSKAPSVPNFSRQLSLRSYSDAPVERSIETKSTHLAPSEPMGFAPIKSPAALTFNIPSYSTQQDQDDDYQIKSPVKTSFDITWPSEYDEPAPSLSVARAPPSFQLGAPPKSPMFAPSLSVHKTQDSFQLGAPPKSPMFAPPRMTLPKSRSDRNEKPRSLLPFRAAEESSQQSSFGSFSRTDSSDAVEKSSGFSSPTFGSFPKDAFGSNAVLEAELKSPRAAEFHMAPLRPRTDDEDPFGLTSPTRRDFSSGNPFDSLTSSQSSQHSGNDDRRPAFQAILPPAHQTFNGFASLDGHARTPSTQTLEPTSIQAPPPRRKLNIESRIDSLSTSPETNVIASTPTQANSHVSPPSRPETPRTKEFLATPAKSIRTRFSSPNMKEQKQLSKLQSEMESKLANRPERPQQAMDDLDALMSPRAEEFTRNPFHLDLTSSAEDISPASSDETIKDGKNGHIWSEPLRQWTPEKLTVDPRSPAQLGSSPIVRNIWDVL